MVKTPYPTEHAEQVAVAGWLRRRGIWFFAVPNGAKMGPAEAAKMKREGMGPGVPDLIIVDQGIKLAVEMKARDPNRKATPDQKRWLRHLEGQGWITNVPNGAEEAIAWLRQHLITHHGLELERFWSTERE